MVFNSSEGGREVKVSGVFVSVSQVLWGVKVD